MNRAVGAALLSFLDQPYDRAMVLSLAPPATRIFSTRISDRAGEH